LSKAVKAVVKKRNRKACGEEKGIESVAAQGGLENKESTTPSSSLPNTPNQFTRVL